MTPALDGAPLPTPRRFQPLRVLSLLRRVLRDPNDTRKVFELFASVGGDDGPRHYAAFLAAPEGPRLLAERSNLLAALADEARLARLPSDSLGAVYARSMRARGLQPSGLLAIRAQTAVDVGADDAHEWFYQRLNVMHDVWHVLTGYGVDPLGEAALLAFSQAQTPNRSFPILLLGAIVKGPTSWRLAWPRYLWRAYRRGRSAQLLTAAPLEEMLACPLDRVREELGVGAPSAWHPEGIWIGTLDGRDA